MILLQRFFQICLFRAGPADLPASHWFMKLVCLIYFCVGTLVSCVDYDWQVSLISSFADTMLMVLVCWSLLSLRGLTDRFNQTLTAMAGTGSLLGIIGLPVFVLFRQVEQQGQLTSLVLLLVLVIVFWSLFVTAHIFRNALNVKPGTAAILTVAYTILSLIVVGVAMSGVA